MFVCVCVCVCVCTLASNHEFAESNALKKKKKHLISSKRLTIVSGTFRV